MDVGCCERCGDLCRTQIALEAVTKKKLWCVNCFLGVAMDTIRTTQTCPVCVKPPISSTIHDDKCIINMMTSKGEYYERYIKIE